MSDLTTNPGSTTDFDDLVSALSVPVELTGGDIPEVMVMDGFARGQAIVGRSRANQTMIGIKLDPAGQAVRVTLELSADKTTKDWWVKRTPEGEEGLSPELTRVISVSCQGQHVGGLAITRREVDGPAPTRSVIQFDVPADRIDPESLLIIEMTGYAHAKGEQDGLLPNAMLGLRVDAIDIEPAEGTLPTQVAGGDTRRSNFMGGNAVITPAAESARLLLELTDDVPLPAILVNKGGRYGRFAARAVRKGAKEVYKGSRTAMGKVGMDSAGTMKRAIESGKLKVTASDLEGNPVPVTVSAQPGPRPRVELDLSGAAGATTLVQLAFDPSVLRRSGHPAHSVWSVIKIS
ncbi:hypothetical protein ACQP1U_13535 [Actinomycetota bacterium]